MKRRVVLVTYYIILTVVLTVFSIVLPFHLSEKEAMERMNIQLYEYKKANGCQYVPEEKMLEVSYSGIEWQRQAFREYAMKYGLSAMGVALLLTLLSNFVDGFGIIFIGAYSLLLYIVKLFSVEAVAFVALACAFSMFIKNSRSSPH